MLHEVLSAAAARQTSRRAPPSCPTPSSPLATCSTMAGGEWPRPWARTAALRARLAPPKTTIWCLPRWRQFPPFRPAGTRARRTTPARRRSTAPPTRPPSSSSSSSRVSCRRALPRSPLISPDLALLRVPLTTPAHASRSHLRRVSGASPGSGGSAATRRARWWSRCTPGWSPPSCCATRRSPGRPAPSPRRRRLPADPITLADPSPDTRPNPNPGPAFDCAAGCARRPGGAAHTQLLVRRRSRMSFTPGHARPSPDHLAGSRPNSPQIAQGVQDAGAGRADDALRRHLAQAHAQERGRQVSARVRLSRPSSPRCAEQHRWRLTGGPRRMQVRRRRAGGSDGERPFGPGVSR